MHQEKINCSRLSAKVNLKFCWRFGETKRNGTEEECTIFPKLLFFPKKNPPLLLEVHVCSKTENYQNTSSRSLTLLL